MYLGSCRDMMARLKPPRSVFLDFPLGRQCGTPGDAEFQKQILRDTLRVLEEATTPGEILDLPYQWKGPFDFASYMKDLQDMLEEEGTEPQEWKPKT
ncbi:MAG: hypothetical protein DRH20_11225 [Deltaproteobacteria bacterium]|nr:MAG: hypothetical protein DRH20_11225 [Deltaproteobacteria bacterium]